MIMIGKVVTVMRFRKEMRVISDINLPPIHYHRRGVRERPTATSLIKISTKFNPRSVCNFRIKGEKEETLMKIKRSKFE